MANRVYIYGTNKTPTKKGNTVRGLPAKGIIEWAYNPTVLIDTLVGAKFLKEAPSIIWTNYKCAISDFREGLKLFSSLFESLVKLGIGSPELDIKWLTDSIKFLTKQRSKFFLTEFTEISALSKDELEDILKQNSFYTQRCVMNASIYRTLLKKKPKKLLKYFNKNIPNDELGIGYFSKVLYY